MGKTDESTWARKNGTLAKQHFFFILLYFRLFAFSVSYTFIPLPTIFNIQHSTATFILNQDDGHLTNKS